MASLLLPWFKVTSLVGQAANEIHLCNCMFVPEEGWNLGYIHILLDELRSYSPNMYSGQYSRHVIISVLIPYWNFEHTRTVILNSG